MTCPCCNDARNWPGTTAALMCCPSCIYCGARLIHRIGKLPISREQATARRREVLADWMEHGHEEGRIRALVKSGPYMEPEDKKK